MGEYIFKRQWAQTDTEETGKLNSSVSFKEVIFYLKHFGLAQLVNHLPPKHNTPRVKKAECGGACL